MIVAPQASRRAGPREVWCVGGRSRDPSARGPGVGVWPAQAGRNEPRKPIPGACRLAHTPQCTRRELGASGPRAATGHGDVMTDHASRVRAAARPTALRAAPLRGWVGLSAKPKAVRGVAKRLVVYNIIMQTKHLVSGSESLLRRPHDLRAPTFRATLSTTPDFRTCGAPSSRRGTPSRCRRRRTRAPRGPGSA